MFNEWYKPSSHLEFPRGGSQAMVDALVRGVTKQGGRVHTRSHVDRILLEGGRAAGVRLRDGATVRSKKAVVTNATLWDVRKLLPGGSFPAAFEEQVDGMPVNRSFMHLHLGFDATGLEGLSMHHIVVDSWARGVRCQKHECIQHMWQSVVVDEYHAAQEEWHYVQRARKSSHGKLLPQPL
jgi:phytoene dehydrogenase-like protein